MTPSFVILLTELITLAALADAQNVHCSSGNDNILSDRDRQYIVDRHNELRASLARGDEIIKGSIKAVSAANMQKMEYSCDIEYALMPHVANCSLHEHSDVGRVFGENFGAYTGYNKMPSHHYMVNKSLVAWWNEMRNQTRINKSKPPANFGKSFAGHWSQMAWATSSYIGCGVAYCPCFAGKTHCYDGRFYCRYFPQGNVLTYQIYKAGKPCSECKKGCVSDGDVLCKQSNKRPPKAPPNLVPGFDVVAATSATSNLHSSIPYAVGTLMTSFWMKGRPKRFVKEEVKDTNVGNCDVWVRS